MALSRIKTWIAEVLTFADLNAEINNILNNANSLISPFTADVAAGGFKLTGVGAATARTDAASLATIQDGTGIYSATVGGTADAITLTPSPAITAYAAGQAFYWIASGANTTAVTLAVSGIAGAKAVTKNGSTALVAGDIASGALVGARYDGTRFQLIAVVADRLLLTGGTLTGDLTFTAASSFQAEGAAVASAAGATDIWAVSDGDTIHVTGSNAITSLGTAPQAGCWKRLIADGAWSMTQGANLNLNAGGANITMAVDDVAIVYADTTTQMDVFVIRKSGAPLVTPLPLSYIAGLTYSNNGADATNDLDIAVGDARDSTNARNITLASALTKQSDVAWAVGTNAGMLDTGVVGNSDYYLWLILRSDTGVVDVLSSLSSTAPTMPTNYDYRRLFGWFKRVGGTIVAFNTYQLEGGGLELRWSAPTLDIDLATTLTTSRRTDAVKVPLNFSTIAELTVLLVEATHNILVWIGCPDESDVDPTLTATPLGNHYLFATNVNITSVRNIRTSSAGLIAARCGSGAGSTVDAYRVVTQAFRWSRR